MLRGNHTARIDDKGRLKIPTSFRRKIEEQYNSPEVYVTSLTGKSALIYPMKEWEKIEQRLILMPTSEPARQEYLLRTSYYGQEGEIDAQGRVLMPQMLRREAEIFGDVSVMGKAEFLDVWNSERIGKHMIEKPFTPDLLEVLSKYGI